MFETISALSLSVTSCVWAGWGEFAFSCPLSWKQIVSHTPRPTLSTADQLHHNPPICQPYLCVDDGGGCPPKLWNMIPLTTDKRLVSDMT